MYKRENFLFFKKLIIVINDSKLKNRENHLKIEAIKNKMMSSGREVYGVVMVNSRQKMQSEQYFKLKYNLEILSASFFAISIKFWIRKHSGTF